MEPGDRDDGAPGGEDRPLDPADGPKLFGERKGERPSWILFGRGSVRRLESAPQRNVLGGGAALQFVMEDTLAMMTSAAHGEWLLAPFVDPTVVASRKAFLKELSKQCGVARSKLDAWLAVTANVQQLVTNDVDRLSAAYGAVTGNLNISSLCLYSGPARYSSSTLARSYLGNFGAVKSQGNRIAWLATGDAALKQKQRRADFVSHYGQLLLEVATLVLPHHGSDHNFDPDLLDKVNPQICVAAADRFSTWKHPGAHAVQAVCSRPAVLQVVTSKPPSGAWEFGTLG